MIKPLIAEHLAAVRAPRPEPTRHEQAVMQACKEVGNAVDALEAARGVDQRSLSDARRVLISKAKRLRNLIGAKEVDLGSR